MGFLAFIDARSGQPAPTIFTGALGSTTSAGPALEIDAIAIESVLTGLDAESGAALQAERAAPRAAHEPTSGEIGLYIVARASDGQLQILDSTALARPENAGALALVTAYLQSADSAARAGAIVRALAEGGAETRHRAALDLESDQRLIAALTADQTTTLASLLTTRDRNDPELSVLLRVVAVSSLDDRVAICLSLLRGAAADRVLPELRALIKVQEFGLNLADLEPFLGDDVDIQIQRRAAHLAARLRTSAAAARLEAIARQATDLDLGSEALIGLAGRCPPDLIDAAWRRIALLVDTAPPAAKPSAIDQVLEARDLQKLRSSPYTGDRLRDMACGFLLVRGSAEERQWLRDHLPTLRDRNLARFLEAMLSMPWADFEEAW